MEYLSDIRVLGDLCLNVLFYYELFNRSIRKNNFEVVSYPTIISSFSAISDFGVTLGCMLRDSYMIQLC